MKKNNYILYQFVLFILLVGTGCASTNEARKHHIHLLQDAYVSFEGNDAQLKKKGETFEAPKSPMLVEYPGFSSLLIVPNETDQGETQLRLKRTKEYDLDLRERNLEKTLKEKSTKDFNKLVIRISEIQRLLAFRNASDALSQTRELQRQFPNVRSLKFLEASCLVILHQRTQARDVLKSALKEFPDFRPGWDLFHSILSSKKEKSE